MIGGGIDISRAARRAARGGCVARTHLRLLASARRVGLDRRLRACQPHPRALRVCRGWVGEALSRASASAFGRCERCAFTPPPVAGAALREQPAGWCEV